MDINDFTQIHLKMKRLILGLIKNNVEPKAIVNIYFGKVEYHFSHNNIIYKITLEEIK